MDKHWTTSATVVGLFPVGKSVVYDCMYLANTRPAFTCAIAHYTMFHQLHGTAASGDGAYISQYFLTAVSLTLATLFKGAIVGN